MNTLHYLISTTPSIISIHLCPFSLSSHALLDSLTTPLHLSHIYMCLCTCVYIYTQIKIGILGSLFGVSFLYTFGGNQLFHLHLRKCLRRVGRKMVQARRQCHMVQDREFYKQQVCCSHEISSLF